MNEWKKGKHERAESNREEVFSFCFRFVRSSCRFFSLLCFLMRIRKVIKAHSKYSLFSFSLFRSLPSMYSSSFVHSKNITSSAFALAHNMIGAQAGASWIVDSWFFSYFFASWLRNVMSSDLIPFYLTLNACFNFNQLGIFASIFNWIVLGGLKTSISITCAEHNFICCTCKQTNWTGAKEKKRKMRFKYSPIWNIFIIMVFTTRHFDWWRANSISRSKFTGHSLTKYTENYKNDSFHDFKFRVFLMNSNYPFDK